MPILKVFPWNIWLLGTVLIMFAPGCGSKEEGDTNDAQEIDSTKAAVLNIEGELFSIPSPMQTAFLIRQIGTNYNPAMLHDAGKASAYSSTFKQSLNLGVYGADLGYVTIYDKTQEAIKLMKSVRKLGDDLGITGAFDAKLMTKFEQNIGNKDSLLVLVSDAYRASDAFLKNNERNEVSGLVLTGGWIESLYFATSVAMENGNEDIIRRVAEQKSSLRGIIKILQKSADKPEYAKLNEGLTDLSSVFEKVEFRYVYEKPTVEPDHQLTVVNGKTEIKITPEQLQAITEKIKAIRNQIIE